MRNKIFLSIFFSFFIGLSVHADISQLSSLERSDLTDQFFFQKIGTGHDLMATAFYFKVEYPYSAISNYVYLTAKLVECPDDTYTGCTTKMTVNNGVATTEGISIIYFQAGVASDWGDASYQMTPDKYYYVYTLPRIYSNYDDYYGFGADTAYASTVFADDANCGDLSTVCAYEFMYFRLLGADDVYNDISRVSRLTPANGTTDLTNTVQFTGFFSNTAYDKLVIDIYNRDKNQTENVITVNASLGLGLPYVINAELNNGNYSWISYLFNYTTGSSSPEFYNQSPYYFMVGTTTPALPAFNCGDSPDLSLEALCAGVATTTSMTDIHFLGDIECALKKVAGWSFYPSCPALQKFGLTYAQLKTVFPFNAYFGLTDAITATASSSMATSTSGTIDMPFITASGTFVMLPVISSTSMPNLIGQSNTTLIRNSIKYVIWLAVAFLIFITFKKI